MTKEQKTTVLHCTQTTATIVFVLVGTLFLFAGCAQLYKILSLTNEQAAAQIAQDQNATIKIIEQARWTGHEIITTTLAGIGAILSGLLTKWLSTERKITTALISGIESAPDTGTKESVKAKATAAGIEPKLNARVRALT